LKPQQRDLTPVLPRPVEPAPRKRTFADTTATSAKGHKRTSGGFTAALEKIAGNGVRTIIVETANRFARDAADSPDQFVDETPTAVLIRQILGAVAQFDKAMTVAKLRGVRERKRRKTGEKAEGRKSYAEVNPEMVVLARKLSEQRPKLSLRQISAQLSAAGYRTPKGNPYSASAVQSMLT
jgi:hypothetical protein